VLVEKLPNSSSLVAIQFRFRKGKLLELLSRSFCFESKQVGLNFRIESEAIFFFFRDKIKEFAVQEFDKPSVIFTVTSTVMLLNT